MGAAGLSSFWGTPMAEKPHNPRVLRPKSAPTAVAPTTSATLLLAANTARGVCLISNAHASATVYLGRDNTVTSSNGVPLPAGETLTDGLSTDAWWGIMASGTGDVRVLEI